MERVRIMEEEIANDFADLLDSGERIAEYFGKPYRQTMYLLETGKLPAWKIGHKWHSTRTKLRRRLMGDDSDGAANDHPQHTRSARNHPRDTLQ